MTDTQPLVELALAMLRLVVLGSLPVVLVAALVGVLVGVGQAVTQLQDQALPFAVKFIAVAAVVALGLPWLGKATATFVNELFAAIARIA